MAEVILRAPLSELAGAKAHQVQAETVRSALFELESRLPALAGWILDERRHLREHVNVYVNGAQAREETPVVEGDRIRVLPAITGG